MELPAWARPVIPGPGGAPLLYAGTLAGRPAAVMAFEPRRSDLPLQVAFPVLLANLAGELLGGSETPLEAIAPGAPVTLAIPDGAIGVRVERPDGTHGRARGSRRGSAGSVTFARTDLLGVYTRRPRIAEPGCDASPDVGRRPPSPSAVASAAAPALGRRLAHVPSGRPGRPGPLRRGPARRGRVADRPRRRRPAPGAGRSAGGEPWHRRRSRVRLRRPTARPNARDELWIPIVLVALLVLTLEWLVYERDTLARLRRGLAARFRGARPAGRGA